MTEQLDSLRAEVEDMSLRILANLNRRARRALDIAAEKQRMGVPMRDPYRESQLLDRLVRGNEGPLDAPTVRALFRSILDASVALMEGRRQRGLRVGADGGPAVGVTVRGHTIGGAEPVYVAGPCAVENEDQMEIAARGLAALGVRFFRAGAFKPRTSPYAFQGLGERGLRLLRTAADRHGLLAVTEATSTDNAEKVAEHADVIQVGARNMYNYELLRAVGRTGKPVLLKRAFAATLDEWLNAAEYVALSGSDASCSASAASAPSSARRGPRWICDRAARPRGVAAAGARRRVATRRAGATSSRRSRARRSRAGATASWSRCTRDPDLALSDAEQQITIEDFAALQRAVREGLGELAASLGAHAPERARAEARPHHAMAGGRP